MRAGRCPVNISLYIVDKNDSSGSIENFSNNTPEYHLRLRFQHLFRRDKNSVKIFDAGYFLFKHTQSVGRIGTEIDGTSGFFYLHYKLPHSRLRFYIKLMPMGQT